MSEKDRYVRELMPAHPGFSKSTPTEMCEKDVRRMLRDWKLGVETYMRPRPTSVDVHYRFGLSDCHDTNMEQWSGITIKWNKALMLAKEGDVLTVEFELRRKSRGDGSDTKLFEVCVLRDEIYVIDWSGDWSEVIASIWPTP